VWADACRLIDALRFFCGEVARVRALTAGPKPAPGGLVVQLELVEGTVGVLTCATFARPEPRIELEMLGEGWSLRLGKDVGNLRLDERDKTTILRGLNNPAADQAAAFLSALKTGSRTAVGPDYGEALRNMAVCEAATRSAKEGRPVALEELLGEK
jgi:predicted dehydrogenase